MCVAVAPALSPRGRCIDKMRPTFIVLGSSLVFAACVASDKDGTSETEQAVTATTQTTSVPFQLATPNPMHLGGFQIGGGALTIGITAQARWRSTVNTDFTWD